MAGRIETLTGNLRAIINTANQLGVVKEDIIAVLRNANSNEFYLIYWSHE